MENRKWLISCLFSTNVVDKLLSTTLSIQMHPGNLHSTGKVGGVDPV